jgi:hypothetical protein
MTADPHLEQRLQEQGMKTALRHYRQAEAAYGKNDLEAANAQFRAFIEAVFEVVARVRIGVALKRGEARKRLEAVGFIKGDEAQTIRLVVSLTSEAGSHAGQTSRDKADIIRSLSIAVAFIGLSLLPALVRVEDLLGANLKSPVVGWRIAKDAELLTSCPTCKEDQFLDEGTVSRDEEETIYECKNGCQVIVVVGKPGDSPWPGRGYRLGDHVIRNAQDIRMPVLGTGGTVLIPASPAALMKKQPRGRSSPK